MMNREMMIEAIKNLGEDVLYTEGQDGMIYVTINDFEGFTEDGEEIDRELENEEAVDNFVDMVKENGTPQTKWFDWFIDCYQFDGFKVKIEYASSDI